MTDETKKPDARSTASENLSPLSVRRALLSVYDKEGIVELARDLSSLGIELLSSGGTARLLEDASIPVTRVAEYTGFPEMLDGRVKTLHPRIHAGILAVRDNPQHMQDLERSQVEPIDLVVVNLYPFEQTARMEGIGFGEIVEMIDIGGPAMVRAAAKNFRHVAVLVDPGDYRSVVDELREIGTLSPDKRFDLALKAFRHTASYDNAIFSYLSLLEADGSLRPGSEGSPFPQKLTLEYEKVSDMRYGENPHQRAAFYREMQGNAASTANAVQVQGKGLSFNNILDLDAALRLAADLPEVGCAVIKHGNPCGVALGRRPVEAFRRARECDPLSAFGGVVGINSRVDAEMAEAMVETFFEALICPDLDRAAAEILRRKKKLRVLTASGPFADPPLGPDIRRVAGGVLLQDWDRGDREVDQFKVVTRRQPSKKEWGALRFAWLVVRHIKSNAIVFSRADRTVGIGAGQMSRVDSVRLGTMKAETGLEGTVLASDAFFPFRDGVDTAAEVGVTAMIQPGGSIRDKEVIAAADEHGLAMVFTGRRHFRH
jgi:phosphoribosylaminoimidazolecarboxamide formyltransferase/IMP cyclohydrolase